MSVRLLVPSAAVLALVVGALAEDREGAREAGRATPAADRPENAAAASLDSHIADCLQLANQEEIALTRWSLERTQNPQVREFAEKLIEEHTAFGQKLAKFSPRPAAEFSTAATTGTNQPPQRREAANAGSPQRPAPANAGERRPEESAAPYHGAAEDDLAGQMHALARRMAAECLQITQSDLSQKEGDEFDKCFLGVQIAMHNGMLAKLKASEGYVSAEFQSVLQEATMATQQHKDHAVQLMEQIAAASGSAGADRRDTTSATPPRTGAPRTDDERDPPRRQE
jgi:predicted outer membrane protein